MTSSPELYDLFLVLAPMRLGAARGALDAGLQGERRSQLAAALTPFAVDALLLGADGLADLARAIVDASGGEPASLTAAIEVLEASATALGGGDESGARVDESALKRRAADLRAHLPGDGAPTAELAGGGRPAPDRSVRHEGTTGAANDDGGEWAPDLAEDMVGAFLDECHERIDGLAEKLLLLEERGDDAELISALFRDLHTLKGSSAFAGLARMNRVAHAAEDLVAELRTGHRSVDRAVVDALLAALDVLRAILERAQRRAPIDVDPTRVLVRLRNPAAPARDGGDHLASPLDLAGDPEQAATIDRSEAAPDAAQREPGAALSTATAGRAAQAGAGTLRIEFEKVDLLLNLVGELVLAKSRLTGAAERHASIPQDLAQLRRLFTHALDPRKATVSHPLIEDLQRTERVLGEAHVDLDGGLANLGLALGQMRDQVMKLRMIPIARLFTKYQRTVRELSHKLGKEVRVELEGADTELDKVLVERLDDPLLHLVRNAIDHGIERPHAREAAGKARVGVLRLRARQRGGSIVVAIHDDGAGMDAAKLKARAVEKALITETEADAMTEREAFDLIFAPGFSTASAVSDVSGRGVGMDVVREAIARLKGTIVVESQKGVGSTIELRLPLTLAITQVLAARVGGESIAIPLDAVVSARAVTPGDLEALADTSTLRAFGRLVPIIDLTRTLGLDPTADLAQAASAYVVIVDASGELFGLLVQQLLGRHEVVIKSLGPLLLDAPFVAGATLVDDRVLLLLDLVAVTTAAKAGGHPAVIPQAAPEARAASRGKKILIAEDGDTVREAIRRAFEARGYHVTTAVDGVEALALARAQRFDAITTDVVMPNLDGYELTRALRADPVHAAVPIVMLTSKDTRIDELRGLDAGADAYVTKPVDSGDLVRRVEALLARVGSSG